MHELSIKQKNKEQGRLRARELAVAKQSQPTTTSTRHGARNQHRHKHFAKWILSVFPHVLEECNDNDLNLDSSTRTQKHILDVAGGKGELSARLTLCHSLYVVMVDPRRADVASVYMKDVVPKLPQKWQASVQKRIHDNPMFVQDLLRRRYKQLVMPFDVSDPVLCRDNLHDAKKQKESIQRNISDDLNQNIQNASLIIGLHSDGATEAIVDAALSYNKPFVVVPCCVFPNLFNNRFITVQEHDKSGDLKEKQIPVRTHEQFCAYLLNKNPRFRKDVLPFEGRNIAIWWDGKA